MAYESNAIFWIEVEKIVPNPFQPRREFDEAKLKELSDSIRMYGVLQPLVVTRRELIREDGTFSTEYELIAGERRLRASKLAGLTQVPVIIRTGEESELMKLELAIIENLQREDLNPVDRALAFRQLADSFGLSHADVARKVGRSREYVSNSIRLLALPETILNALRLNDISDGHARTLLMLNDRPEEQDVVFREILLKKLSVREVERIARKIATEKVRKKDAHDAELLEIERGFTEALGTRVEIKKTDYGGRLTIDYFAADDLRKMLDTLHKGEQAAYGATNTGLLGHLTVATPLEAVAETPEAEVPPQEEVFTRHDTLAVPESPALDAADDTEGHDENATISEVLHKVEELDHTDDGTLEIAATVPEAPPASPKSDDSDLYSLKNFSI
jgi:ParB family chromosome partitioning protein